MPSEKDLERTVRHYLAIRGWWFPSKSPFPHGDPDIIACRNNQVLLIELKLPGKERNLSIGQQRTKALVEASGNDYHVASSLEAVAEIEERVTGVPKAVLL